MVSVSWGEYENKCHCPGFATFDLRISTKIMPTKFLFLTVRVHCSGTGDPGFDEALRNKTGIERRKKSFEVYKKPGTSAF